MKYDRQMQNIIEKQQILM